MIKQDNLNQYIPPENKPRKAYYTLKDVEVHNHANDCWVIIFNKVYDVTKLI
jgi:cytochrome b involved in lipid metabolism